MSSNILEIRVSFPWNMMRSSSELFGQVMEFDLHFLMQEGPPNDGNCEAMKIWCLKNAFIIPKAMNLLCLSSLGTLMLTADVLLVQHVYLIRLQNILKKYATKRITFCA